MHEVVCGMPLKKRLQKLGSSHCLLITKETMQHMGLEEDDVVVMELVGDALVIRRDGRPAPDALQLLSALELLKDALPGGEDLPELDQQILQVLGRKGPMPTTDIANELPSARDTTYKALRRLDARGFVRKVGKNYQLV